MPMVEINFLCVHKKLRAKRLGPVLIKEVTRRVNLTGVWQAVYTAGALLPKPVSKNRYALKLVIFSFSLGASRIRFRKYSASFIALTNSRVSLARTDTTTALSTQRS
jgi:hypothetical protein